MSEIQVGDVIESTEHNPHWRGVRWRITDIVEGLAIHRIAMWVVPIREIGPDKLWRVTPAGTEEAYGEMVKPTRSKV